MQIKKYRAGTLAEAINQVKADFGSEAIILESQKTKRHGLLGLLGVKEIELTAGTDPKFSFEQNQPAAKTAALAPTLPPPAGEAPRPASANIHDEIREIKAALRYISKQEPDFPTFLLSSPLAKIYRTLLTLGVDNAIAQSITQAMSNDLTGNQLKQISDVENYLRQKVSVLLPVTGPEKFTGQAKIISLIGPTGVGKTTTLAKLAAHYSLFERRKVALITIDVYRIAAAEQLRIYADILNAPIEVVYTTDEFLAALNKHKDKELILVDTAGRSPKNDTQMQQLEAFIDQVPQAELHLVLAAPTKEEDNFEAIRRFSVLPVSRLIFTKLDETDKIGSLVNIVSVSGLPISFVTFGQNVPDDFGLADSLQLAGSILKDLPQKLNLEKE